ncbi:hypothetical protein [Bacillus sp. RO1]|uniref:hypothetical protein n=1 Tax=Bacillus sp. RO1 TaxID=2722703 RepID=UPI001456A66C|nr:hypothetical protein [Bacillus sp. RO1]NLP49149.1 hypothetical protein [Bacillus sp. RO1]
MKTCVTRKKEKGGPHGHHEDFSKQEKGAEKFHRRYEDHHDKEKREDLPPNEDLLTTKYH